MRSAEFVENLGILGEASRIVFGKDHLPVDLDIKDSAAPRDEFR